MAPKGRRAEALSSRIRSLVRAIQENDEAQIEDAVLRLSRSRRLFSPLAFAISAVVLLFEGLRLLVSNWRLTLIQVLPAMWIWLLMFDLKIHVLHGKSFNVVRGPVLIPIVLVIIAITIACLFLNAVFAFAVSRPTPEIRPAVSDAHGRLGPIALVGIVLGSLVAFSTVIVTRWGRPWFTIALGITVGLMMLLYVAVPARLVGAERPQQSRRDRMWTTIVSGTISVAVCTPPYTIGRISILMLGSKALLIPGIVLLLIAVTLQAGATGAVSALKLSVSLTPGRRQAA